MNGIYLRGEIYNAKLENGLGSEQSGYRPVLIIQNDTGNKYSPTVIVAAVSSMKKKDYMPTHITLPKEIGIEENSIVLLEQLRTLDKQRLLEYVCKVDADTMNLIDKALMISVGVKQEKESNHVSHTNKAEEIKEGRNEMILCLCGVCVSQFIHSPEYAVKKLTQEHKEKELCNYCQVRKGRDYRIIRRLSMNNGQSRPEKKES